MAQGPLAGTGHYTLMGKTNGLSKAERLQMSRYLVQQAFFDTVALEKYQEWLVGPPKGDGNYTAMAWINGPSKARKSG